MPVFTDLLQQGRKREALRLASTLFWIMLIVLGAMTAFFILVGRARSCRCSPADVHAAADDAHGRALPACCSRSCCCSGLNGLLVGVLQSYDHFTIPAISPAVWNLVIIVLLVVLRPTSTATRRNIYAYAIASLVATLVQLLLIASARSRASTSACSSRSTGTTRASARCSC